MKAKFPFKLNVLPDGPRANSHLGPCLWAVDYSYENASPDLGARVRYVASRVELGLNHLGEYYNRP